MSWGGMGGGAFGGGAKTSAAVGLPFAGMPEELAEKAQKILDREPDHPPIDARYDPIETDRRPFTLRRFLRPELGRLGVALALVVLETVLGQAGPLLTKIGIDQGVLAKSTTALVAAAIAYIVATILGGAAEAARLWWTGRLGEDLTYNLRVRVFSQFQRLSLDFFTEEKAGRLMTRMTSDIEALTTLFQDGLINLVVQGLTLLVITVVLFVLNPHLAAITILCVVPAMTAMTLWFRSASDRGYTRVRDRIAEVLADLQENLSGIRIITAVNRRRHNLVHHRNVVGDYRAANNYTAKVNAVYGPGTEVVGLLGQAVILLVGGHLVLEHRLTIGELTAFVLYLTEFFAPIQQLVQLYNTYQSGRAAVAKLQELLGTEPSVAEAPDAEVLPPITGDIVFEDVAFAYGPAFPPVLQDVDLHIHPGETFALVGETGAGKSTIAKLVTRFYDPVAGRVLIDGHDLRTVTLASLRRQLGVVPQEPFLFHGTIRDNVAFARPEADDAEVLAACRAVGLDDLIDRLPDGIHAIVHERGSSLSSGERQLLALARAFLARPRVLVLDEATSSLDLRSESVIERALDVVLEGRTAIIIAHRLATAMRADRLAVVDDGRIVELGTHDELVALGGRYAAMYRTWESHTGTA